MITNQISALLLLQNDYIYYYYVSYRLIITSDG